MHPHRARFISIVLHMMVPFPPLHRILYAPTVIYVHPKESSSMVKLINLSRGRSKWCMHACIDDGLVGPQMEVSHVSVLARIYKHVAQKGVVWCLNNQFHNFDVARASVTKKSRHWVRCTCSRTHMYSIYASPLPPLRRVLYTTICMCTHESLPSSRSG